MDLTVVWSPEAIEREISKASPKSRNTQKVNGCDQRNLSNDSIRRCHR
jgi:hypothetical protein